MFVKRFDSSKAEEAYGILCQRIYPLANGESSLELAPPPFGSTYCEVEPLGATSPHNHYDGETFIILKGQGRMQIGDEAQDVSPGDVVLIPPFSHHTLTNISKIDRLQFLSVYWEARGRAFDDTPPKRIFLASAPPTPNGELHLGHLSGPYVVADILRRFYRLQGAEVHYVCGSDDNQSFVPAKGVALGLTAEGVIDKFVPQITAVQEKIGAKADYFLRPHGNAAYVSFVQDFFLQLVNKGHLVLKDSEVLYCESCRAYLHEAYVKGGCPSCQLPTSGNGCEACGLTNDCVDLTDPQCKQCNSVPVRKRMAKYYFDLAPWKEKLSAFLNKATVPVPFRPFANTVLEKGMREISGTHPCPWGIALPPSLVTDQTQGQTIYAWLEMAAGYVYMAKALGKDGDYTTLLASAESRFIQCFGFDNTYFYLALVPALLMAYDEKITPPDSFVINFFYLLDGKKFSTSRNHAVWGKDFLDKVHPDVARYYLAATRAETSESNFSLSECQARVADQLEGQWNQLALKLESLCTANGNQMPGRERSLRPDQQAFLRRLEDAYSQATYCYRAESFSMNRLATLLDTLVCDVQARATGALALAENQSLLPLFKTESALVFTAAKYLGLIASPLMPQIGGELYAKFGGATAVTWGTHIEIILEGRPFLENRLWSDRYVKSLEGIQALINVD